MVSRLWLPLGVLLTMCSRRRRVHLLVLSVGVHSHMDNMYDQNCGSGVTAVVFLEVPGARQLPKLEEGLRSRKLSVHSIRDPCNGTKNHTYLVITTDVQSGVIDSGERHLKITLNRWLSRKLELTGVHIPSKVPGVQKESMLEGLIPHLGIVAGDFNLNPTAVESAHSKCIHANADGSHGGMQALSTGLEKLSSSTTLVPTGLKPEHSGVGVCYSWPVDMTLVYFTTLSTIAATFTWFRRRS
eukprot:Sspe_Gene.72387::Locus_43193_Transcript_1_1_Confidence_1.000_Length_1049::g.72387::m.72387